MNTLNMARTALLLATLSLGVGNQALALDGIPADDQLKYGEDLVVSASALFANEDRAYLGGEADSLVWRFMGVGKFDSDTPDVDPETAWRAHSQEHHHAINQTHDDERNQADRGERSGRQLWTAVNLKTGFEYEVDLPEEFGNRLFRRAEQMGWNAGNEGSAVSRDSDTEDNTRGWSNGNDTRTRRFNNTSYPFRAMGQMGGGTTSGCSGTLVGRHHVLTAAHCLYTMSSDSWVSSAGTRFRPGREGTCNNASCEPYGEFNARWYFTPSQFRAVDNNWAYDYGIMVTWGNPGNATGWLGYVATSQNTLNSYCDKVPFGPGYLGGNCYNRGYPACGFAEAPANCQQGWAYQDLNPCEMGSFSSTGTDGWKSIFRTNCDMGRGHSGSALFTDVWNGSGKVVFGVASTQSCSTCDAGSDWPNGFRRVTPDVLSAISYFKSAFP